MSAERLDTLEATFRRIATTRMRGVPVLHAALSVQAVGFVREPAAAAASASAKPAPTPMLMGVLVTPWFMNVLRLPISAVADGAAAGLLPVGATAARGYGEHRLDFVGAHEPTIGAFEQASLFSPMFSFADQPAAVATAREVLRLLRQPVAASRVAA
ncbi:[NiFe]-hydrogenase assembly chaperone HybE [Sphaerotilus sp.]|uniref:[NiFe]-hydrogenase assembly chaperone HybE n=1 Tax=Sphaerotilus sp. TaxID=2093942 RepID=UPI002ACE6A24|nr:[NiFe]-hydrogenase assembly chaperone HybE [Sphaerotilus sp.]MDZ7858317.1 [NiFe]-hydrogenase assembly chaperone HybE [Sphaerotilus sp.]